MILFNMINFYIVATPIGNYDDITLRAINTLKQVDFIVCEQEKEYKKLFGILGIPIKKYILCNEHKEDESLDLTMPLLKKGEVGALICDGGTPIFEDPGFKLLQAIKAGGFTITSLPGASSIMTAITLCPFSMRNFFYAGLLPQKEGEREKTLLDLLKRNEPVIIIEAPYRLKNTIMLLKKYAGDRHIFIPYNLTLQDEFFFAGYPIEIEKQLQMRNIIKGEFLIVINRKNTFKNKKI